MCADRNTVGRRAVIAGLGMAGVGGGALAQGAPPAAGGAAGSAAAPAAWRPLFEPQDAWLERPARHRLVFDVVSPRGIGAALAYADNYFLANKSGYDLDPSELAVVIILRHTATPFAYTDAVWASYGELIAKMIDYQPAKADATAAHNPYLGKAGGQGGATIDGLAERGVQFAVCGMATDNMIDNLTAKTGAKAEELQALMRAHLIPNAHLAAAGIVALNRAQEHGYALATTG